jgi:hypothetical protein
MIEGGTPEEVAGKESGAKMICSKTIKARHPQRVHGAWRENGGSKEMASR